MKPTFFVCLGEGGGLRFASPTLRLLGINSCPGRVKSCFLTSLCDVDTNKPVLATIYYEPYSTMSCCNQLEDVYDRVHKRNSGSSNSGFDCLNRISLYNNETFNTYFLFPKMVGEEGRSILENYAKLGTSEILLRELDGRFGTGKATE